MIEDDLRAVQEELDRACARAGRDPRSVTLIAVSKTKPVEDIRRAYDLGVRDFGENRPQELLQKYEALPKDIRWHMIGHLQTNKVRSLMGRTALIHAIDTERLAGVIDREAERAGITVEGLLEVNVAGEASKFGFTCQEALDFAGQLGRYRFLKVTGLMTVAPRVEDREENRPVFDRLRQLIVDINKKNIDNVTMTTLSMGMTGDYPVAVEAGATCVRVGSGIFGQR